MARKKWSNCMAISITHLKIVRFIPLGLHEIWNLLQDTHFFFLFFSRRYNPWWVLACFNISFHILLSLHFSLQFLTFSFFKSSSPSSSHHSLGLPTALDAHSSHSVNVLTIPVVLILITCAAQRNICDFINITIFFSLVRISNS
jgi:hypothetical protein